MATASIIPGVGINSTLVLGKLLYSVISLLRKLQQPLLIAYGPGQAQSEPILVTLPKLGLRLMFDNGDEQRLMLIEILSFEHLQFHHRAQLLNGDGPPTFKLVYNRIFGPTLPGRLDRAKGVYTLTYSGVALRFRVEAALLAKLEGLGTEQVLSRLNSWDRARDVLCVAVAIFQGPSYEAFQERMQVLAACDGVGVLVDILQGCATVDAGGKRHEIRIGVSLQHDVLRALGPPEGTFPHRRGRFHNYFRHGLDVLYSGGLVAKLVVHNGGVVDGLDFMRWAKCRWEFVAGRERCRPGPFGGLDAAFVAAAGARLGPVILNRSEQELSNDDDLAMMDDDECKKLDLLERLHEYKTWGQLRLYGMGRSVWEVVEESDLVSNVLVY